MPNRILHEKICVSETIAQLTADEERFFYRLMVQCDDFGRFDGRASVIRARCFPLRIDSISDSDVAGWLAALARVGLVVMYEAQGHDFLRVTTWERHQQTRAKRSKYPDPETHAKESACIGYPMHADVPVSGIREAINEKRYTRSGVDARAHAPEAAEPPPASATETGHDQILDVPAPLAGFHAVLVGTRGYAPSPAFFELVTERYGSLDLRQEALKMQSWLADPAYNRRHRSATTKFILGWFEREVSKGGTPPNRENGTNGRGPATPKRSTSWADFEGRHGYHSAAPEARHGD